MPRLLVWTRRIQTPQNQKELAALRVSIEKGRPYGDAHTTRKLGFQLSYRHAVMVEEIAPAPPFPQHYVKPEVQMRKIYKLWGKS